RRFRRLGGRIAVRRFRGRRFGGGVRGRRFGRLGRRLIGGVPFALLVGDHAQRVPVAVDRFVERRFGGREGLGGRALLALERVVRAPLLTGPGFADVQRIP